METKKTPATLPQLLKTEPVLQRFNEVLGKNSPAFISSLLTIYKDSDKLKDCDPKSIIAAAGTAAILKLPILPQLGYAHIIPYKDKATFQISYKGLIQLAMRSGMYKNINATEIYEGQIKEHNYITGELKLGERTSDKVVGYAAYMELINGFSKTLYMSKEEMESHALRYSDSYRADKNKSWSMWAKNFDTMARKTILKKMLTTYAPLSIEMQDNALATALKADQAVISKDKFTYIDNEGDDNFDAVDTETGEIIEVDDFVKGAEPIDTANEEKD